MERRASSPGQPPSGWQPLGRTPRGPTGPFARLARTHALSAAGDVLVAVGLAGSLFFSISPDDARPRVVLYLLLTVAPFAVVAPLIGPLVDRRSEGRRSAVILSLLGRGAACLLMVGDIDSLLLFPEAFTVLVLGKAYGVARASLVPAVVREDAELVQANAKLTLVSGVVGFVVALPAVVVLQIGASWVLFLAAAVFLVGAVVAMSIPRGRASTPTGPAERAELRGAGVRLAASAMAVLRGVVGFLAFLLAFSLRTEDAPTWWFGLILAASALGALAGAAVAPPVRRWIKEERILLACLVFVSLVAVGALRIGGREAAALLAFAVGLAASAGRLCFDAIVQRDAPDADKARSFAQFETRFQLIWVLGAIVPVAITVPRPAGYVVISIVTTVAGAMYLTGRRWPSRAELLRRRDRIEPA